MEPTSKSGWPAFPAMHYDLAEHEHGMTLRDYFAAKALLVGCAANQRPAYDNNTRAKYAYELADAMMEARNVAQ